jgi:hypothetical protein
MYGVFLFDFHFLSSHYNLPLTCVLEAINPCDVLPCLNGAKCQRGYDVEHKCVCAPGSTGNNCDSKYHYPSCTMGRCGRDHIVVGFTITYTISAYHN